MGCGKGAWHRGHRDLACGSCREKIAETAKDVHNAASPLLFPALTSEKRWAKGWVAEWLKAPVLKCEPHRFPQSRRVTLCARLSSFSSFFRASFQALTARLGVAGNSGQLRPPPLTEFKPPARRAHC